MSLELEDTMAETKPVVLDPLERINRYGLECVGPAGDGIVFKAGYWKTGGEYIQKLLVQRLFIQKKKIIKFLYLR